MSKFFKRLFCKHDYSMLHNIPKIKCNIWECKKCKQSYLQVYGLDVGFKISDTQLAMIEHFEINKYK
jgi:ribosomal protein L37AE/L43A